MALTLARLHFNATHCPCVVGAVKPGAALSQS